MISIIGAGVFSIVIIHEFGHLFSAVYYKWNIDFNIDCSDD